jgi:hypothetical protein
MNNDDDLNGGPQCPYCKSSNDCEHLLLMVDRTFRKAEGGLLMDAFNERWSELVEGAGKKWNESDAFDRLLDKVDSLADFDRDLDDEGGPGMSSSYIIFYVKTEGKADHALENF